MLEEPKSRLASNGDIVCNSPKTYPKSLRHLAVLDGWRALSILSVIAGHWFPLGPASWKINSAAAASGMALFFCLSGFLITYFLLKDPRIWPFLVKRVARILPLAWLAMIILAFVNQTELRVIVVNLLFLANLPPSPLMYGGQHLWSLAVEMQFYIFAALLVGTFGRKSLLVLPFICVFVTTIRIADQEVISIVTWHRVDEILAGSCLALLWHYTDNKLELKTHNTLISWLPVFFYILLLIASNPLSGPLGYLRPYCAAAAIGTSLIVFPTLLKTIFECNIAKYIAKISYALYVFHGMFGATWLGGEQASNIIRYILRVPLVLFTWLAAHLSTRYFESSLNRLARRYLSDRDARLIARQRPG